MNSFQALQKLGTMWTGSEGNLDSLVQSEEADEARVASGAGAGAKPSDNDLAPIVE